MTDAADAYQGYANRETWAFCLHYANEQDLYRRTLALAGAYLSDHPQSTDRDLGHYLIDYWETAARDNRPYPVGLRMMTLEVGSWWRVDAAEVGSSVRASLSVEA